MSVYGDDPSQHQEPPPKKLLNVTITILSMSGVHTKESGKKKTSYKPKFTRSKSTSSHAQNEDGVSELGSIATTANQAQPTTTVVTSFERNIPNDKEPDTHKTIMTHIPSLPLSLPSPPSPSCNNGKSSATFNNVIYWAEQDDETHSKLSSFTFQRYFPREDVHTSYGANSTASNSSRRDKNPRYVPQLCPIQVSISRNGTMYKLGSAHVFVSGEENGQSSMNVPVVNFETAFKAAALVSRKSRSSGSGGTGVNLMRLKGDTLKCGLAERATLRVLIRVSDPLNPRIQVNYGLSSSKKQKEQQLLDTVLSNNSTEASWEYDPAQSAVVPKKKINKEIEQKNLSPPSWEYDPAQSAVVPKKKIQKENEQKNVFSPPSFMLFSQDRDHHNRTKNKSCDSGDVQSHTTATSSSTDNSEHHSRSISSVDESSDATTSDSTSHRFSEDYHTDACSLYSESSVELLKIINDISKNRSQNDETITMSSSVQSYRKRRSNAIMSENNSTVRQMHHHLLGNQVPSRDYSSVSSTTSSMSSSTSIDSPPPVKRTLIFPLIQDIADKHSRARTTMNNWGRRFACCGSGSITTSRQLEEEMLLASIHEDSNYSLEGWKHSLQNTVGTEQTFW
eukprot:CAMPEP_0172298462 /NCGR_PEP_ID=MMETSP1058-20130122/1109_1 /TAXON_ID=83371 /ORGANISM="Detonula confervacea, Strain CCMP 353" /LENGTH=619 /DNA_ID=CAMNT_0013007737 /DNA_START=28 /DNA_END=1887 /DNA_ORIENTATION=-